MGDALRIVKEQQKYEVDISPPNCQEVLPS